MKILFIGDIVAKPGRVSVTESLPEIRKTHKPDVVIANVENLTHGRGATIEHLQQMKEAGVDFYTGGDHIFWQKSLIDDLETLPLIRPANYPNTVPGNGYDILDLGKHGNLLIINVMGRTFLNERLDDPFTKVDQIIEETKDKDITAIVVDFHAEATSEKHALAFYLDGRVDAVVGTHTHVPTCDNRVLPKGTMFISDIGMCGSTNSVLGVEPKIIIDLYLTGQNQRFEWKSTGKKAFRSVIIDTDNKSIERIDNILN